MFGEIFFSLEIQMALNELFVYTDIRLSEAQISY